MRKDNDSLECPQKPKPNCTPQAFVADWAGMKPLVTYTIMGVDDAVVLDVSGVLPEGTVWAA